MVFGLENEYVVVGCLGKKYLCGLVCSGESWCVSATCGLKSREYKVTFCRFQYYDIMTLVSAFDLEIRQMEPFPFSVALVTLNLNSHLDVDCRNIKW